MRCVVAREIGADDNTRDRSCPASRPRGDCCDCPAGRIEQGTMARRPAAPRRNASSQPSASPRSFPASRSDRIRTASIDWPIDAGFLVRASIAQSHVGPRSTWAAGNSSRRQSGHRRRRTSYPPKALVPACASRRWQLGAKRGRPHFRGSAARLSRPRARRRVAPGRLRPCSAPRGWRSGGRRVVGPPGAALSGNFARMSRRNRPGCRRTRPPWRLRRTPRLALNGVVTTSKARRSGPSAILAPYFLRNRSRPSVSSASA